MPTKLKKRLSRKEQTELNTYLDFGVTHTTTAGSSHSLPEWIKKIEQLISEADTSSDTHEDTASPDDKIVTQYLQELRRLTAILVAKEEQLGFDYDKPNRSDIEGEIKNTKISIARGFRLLKQTLTNLPLLQAEEDKNEASNTATTTATSLVTPTTMTPPPPGSDEAINALIENLFADEQVKKQIDKAEIESVFTLMNLHVEGLDSNQLLPAARGSIYTQIETLEKLLFGPNNFPTPSEWTEIKPLITEFKKKLYPGKAIVAADVEEYKKGLSEAITKLQTKVEDFYDLTETKKATLEVEPDSEDTFGDSFKEVKNPNPAQSSSTTSSSEDSDETASSNASSSTEEDETEEDDTPFQSIEDKLANIENLKKGLVSLHGFLDTIVSDLKQDPRADDLEIWKSTKDSIKFIIKSLQTSTDHNYFSRELGRLNTIVQNTERDENFVNRIKKIVMEFEHLTKQIHDEYEIDPTFTEIDTKDLVQNNSYTSSSSSGEYEFSNHNPNDEDSDSENFSFSSEEDEDIEIPEIPPVNKKGGKGKNSVTQEQIEEERLQREREREERLRDVSPPPAPREEPRGKNTVVKKKVVGAGSTPRTPLGDRRVEPLVGTPGGDGIRPPDRSLETPEGDTPKPLISRKVPVVPAAKMPLNDYPGIINSYEALVNHYLASADFAVKQANAVKGALALEQIKRESKGLLPKLDSLLGKGKLNPELAARRQEIEDKIDAINKMKIVKNSLGGTFFTDPVIIDTQYMRDQGYEVDGEINYDGILGAADAKVQEIINFNSSNEDEEDSESLELSSSSSNSITQAEHIQKNQSVLVSTFDYTHKPYFSAKAHKAAIVQEFAGGQVVTRAHFKPDTLRGDANFNLAAHLIATHLLREQESGSYAKNKITISGKNVSEETINNLLLICKACSIEVQLVGYPNKDFKEAELEKTRQRLCENNLRENNEPSVALNHFYKNLTGQLKGEKKLLVTEAGLKELEADRRKEIINKYQNFTRGRSSPERRTGEEMARHDDGDGGAPGPAPTPPGPGYHVEEPHSSSSSDEPSRPPTPGSRGDTG